MSNTPKKKFVAVDSEGFVYPLDQRPDVAKAEKAGFKIVEQEARQAK